MSFATVKARVRPLFASARPRVLIVDEEPDTLMSFSRALRRSGYVVSEAESTHAAFEIVTSIWIDAMLCDLHRPGLDGLDLLKTFAALQPGLPLIVTFEPDHEASLRVLQVPTIEYLPKPVTLGALMAAVARAVDRRYQSASPPPDPER